MIHYVVIAGSPSAVGRARPLLRSALEATAYFRGEPRELVAPDGTWALAAIECADPLAAHRIMVRDDAFVVFNGPALAVGAPQSEIGSHLLAAFETGGADAVNAAASGSFNLVGGAPRMGIEATIDFAGIAPLYWTEVDELTIISNRASTAQQVSHHRGLDPSALAWLASLNVLVGQNTPLAEVDRLVPGQYLHVDPTGASHLGPLSSALWHDPTEPLRTELSPREWDAVTDHLVTGATSLLGGPDLVLLLSGGFDSRLCLAIAKAAGLADSVVTVTRGMPDHPEMAGAVEAAETAGFRHLHRPPVQPSSDTNTHSTYAARVENSDVDDARFSSSLWRRLRQSTYRFDATVCPWDGLTPLSPMRGSIVEIKGFLGEILKGPRGVDGQFSKGVPAEAAALAKSFLNSKQPNDPLGVVTHQRFEYQRSWMEAWVDDALRHTHPDNLPLRFYLEHRTGNWSGPMQQFAPGRVTVNLLSSPPAARAAAALTAEAANSRRFHYEVIRRTAPELVSIPFFDDRWPDEIVTEGEFDFSREPFPAPKVAITQAIRSWQWEFLATESEAIDRLFAEGADTVLGDIYRIDDLRAAARRAPEMKRAVEAKAILSAVAIALAATGRAEPVCDEPLSPF